MSDKLRELILKHDNYPSRQTLNKLPHGGDKEIAALTRAADAALARRPTFNDDKAVAALRLLEIQGADLPERLDPVVEDHLQHTNETFLTRALRPLLAAFATLPPQRQDRLSLALAARYIDIVMLKVSRKVQTPFRGLKALGRYGVEATIARAEQSMAPANRRGWESPQLIAIMVELLGGRQWPESLDPLISTAISEGSAGNTTGFLDALRAMPEPRREAILLSRTTLPWAALHACPTPAVMKAAVEAASTSNIPKAQAPTIQAGLAAFGRPIVPNLIEALMGKALKGRTVLLETLAKINPPEAAPAYARMMGDTRRDTRLRAVQAMAELGPDHGLASVDKALQDRKAERRLSAAQVLLQWKDDPRAQTLARTAMDRTSSPEVTRLLESVLTDGVARTYMKARFLDLVASPGYHERLITQMRRDCDRENHKGHLKGGMRFLAVAYSWVHNHAYWYSYRQQQVWFDVLTYNREEPLAACAALMACDAFDRLTRKDYFKRVGEIFGKRLSPAVFEALHEQQDPWRAAAYEWALDHEAATAQMHLCALDDPSETARELAIRGLVAQGATALPHIIPLLESPRGRARGAAARCLQELGDEAALEPLNRAIEKERSEKIRQIMERARRLCDPVLRSLHLGGRSTGAYRADEGFDTSEGISALRAILYDQPSHPLWVRLCNLIERFRHANQLHLALDYIGDAGLDRWPAELRTQPWGWDKDPHLGKWAKTPSDTLWGPIHLLFTDHIDTFLDGILKKAEGRARDRRLDRILVPDFLEHAQQAWAWCDKHDLPIENIDLLYDGGGGYGSTAKTTHMTLYQGFGVSFTRGRTREARADQGFRHLKIKLPKNHSARTRYPTDTRGFMDLAPHLES